MTDPVTGIGGVQGAGGNSRRDSGFLKRGKGKGCRKEREDDRIDISKEASEKVREEGRENGS